MFLPISQVCSNGLGIQSDSSVHFESITLGGLYPLLHWKVKVSFNLELLYPSRWPLVGGNGMPQLTALKIQSGLLQ